MEVEALGSEGAVARLSEGQFLGVWGVGNTKMGDGNCLAQLFINSKCDILSLHENDNEKQLCVHLNIK